MGHSPPHSNLSGNHCDGCFGVRSHGKATPCPARIAAMEKSEEGLGSKIPLKLMKATIIINILYTNSEHRNPPSFRLVWAWEMDRSRMSFPVPKEGLCWRGLDSKWQVI